MSSSRLVLFFILLCVLLLVIRENMTNRPDRLYQTTSGRVEMCLSCHKTEKLDAAHDRLVVGCSPCHLGDFLAIDKEKAHQGIVKNPGDLRVVEKTCGIEGCHAADVKKVKNSLMATNRGILATLLYYWGEAPDQNGDYSVEKLIASGQTSLALDYFRKLCGTCHLWKQKGDLPGFFGEKGGGCTACHFIRDENLSAEAADKVHPLIIKKIPINNCIRCHNRSGRIGISYTGVYESENYGTPYKKGEMSEKKLPGDRYYLNLPADIHYLQGMSCIDCHTRNEIMGDGTNYAHYEQQLEISCGTCHVSTSLQQAGQVPGTTRKNEKLNNIIDEGEAWFINNKINGKKHPLRPPKAGVCDFASHKRVGCEACHSTWVPQCYGCHVKRDMTETHLDKLTMEETPGWWNEGRSYLRYERPMLAMWNDKVVIVTPGCQDIVTLINKAGKPDRQFNTLTMAAINPHTTQTRGRECVDCHTSTKVLGLGEGKAWKENGTWHFAGTDQGLATETGQTPPLDGYVTIDGVALQKSSRPEVRPFNKEELARILRIGLCLECHPKYTDAAYKNYSTDTRCPVFNEDEVVK
ncbi:MAG: amino acid ABC transporter substrate-binding protein [Desulfobulbaceae bacterium]|nr:amino acid ABC transporter substrate-binding protein [Pseudomonadota bacterium]MCG2748984.1 amino acid ABC transporter substrate-binding protein [Desulfobulbaceae bacterium]